MVGVLDPFWESKGYVTPEEFRRFCNSTVPLARMAKRTWRTGETFQADIQIAHFGAKPLTAAQIDWQLVGSNGTVFQSGVLPPVTIPVGSQEIVGAVTCALAGAAPAHKYTLVVGVTAQDGARYENDWDIWVFADSLPLAAPEPVLVTSDMDEALRQAEQGASVLLLLDPANVQTSSQIGFSSVFWNTAWTRNQDAPHAGHPL